MTDWQPDPEYTEYLREQQEPLNESDAFLNTYGFEHNCRCADDYEEGNVVLVSECWGGMCNEALDTCARFKEELSEAHVAAAELRVQVTTLGGEPVA